MLEDGGISTTELYKFNRFKELLNEINNILISFGEQELEVITEGLEQATNDIIGDIKQNSNVSFSLLNYKAVEEIVNTKFKGEHFSKRIWKNRDNLGKLIEKNLQDIVASGMNKDKAVEQIMNIHNSSFANADRLVRTETMRCINSGQLETYKARGRTHGYYSYSKDRRTCDKCKKLGEDTKKNPLPLEELEPVHHPNCRCTILPVVDLKKYEKDDIIEKNTKDKDIIDVHTVGKLENKIYKDRFKDLITDEVIITDNQIEHIKERRGKEFYNKYKNEFLNIINNPDYIFEDNIRPNTLIVCKQFKEDDKYINVVLRLAINVQKGYKNSIITSICENQRRFEQRIRNNLYIYKKE